MEKFGFIAGIIALVVLGFFILLLIVCGIGLILENDLHKYKIENHNLKQQLNNMANDLGVKNIAYDKLFDENRKLALQNNSLIHDLYLNKRKLSRYKKVLSITDELLDEEKSKNNEKKK